MANTPTARKRTRQIAKRTLRNKAIKNRVKSAVRNFEESLNSGDVSQASDKLRKAVHMIDRAASKGVIHKNKAARLKSQLMRKFNQLQQNKAS